MDSAFRRFSRKNKRTCISSTQLPRATSLSALNSNQSVTEPLMVVGSFSELYPPAHEDSLRPLHKHMSSKHRPQPSCISQQFTNDSISLEPEGVACAESTTPVLQPVTCEEKIIPEVSPGVCMRKTTPELHSVIEEETETSSEDGNPQSLDKELSANNKVITRHSDRKVQTS